MTINACAVQQLQFGITRFFVTHHCFFLFVNQTRSPWLFNVAPVVSRDLATLLFRDTLNMSSCSTTTVFPRWDPVLRRLVHDDPNSSCATTIYDPHWDPRLRRLIHDVLLKRRADPETVLAFEQASCTTLEAAQSLTEESQCLQSFPDTRSEFLQQVATAASDTAGQRNL
jgi:hypothetical protein